MRTLIISLLLLNTIYSQQDRTTMGVSLQTQNGLNNNSSINPEQMDLINQGLQKYEYQSNRDTLLFINPLSGGMMNINEGGKHFITFYPDEERGENAQITYNCGVLRTFDQNSSTVTEIGGFYSTAFT